MVKGKLLQNLHKLINLGTNSPFVYEVAKDSVLLAFSEPKPLFTDSEKSQAGNLIKTALPLLEKSFALLHGSLNPDLRQNAQRCRSGLQYLIDEFRDDTKTYEDLKPVLSCDAVRCVEEYIRRTKDVESEYIRPVPQDLTVIPQSHIWWFQDDDNDSIDVNNNDE